MNKKLLYITSRVFWPTKSGHEVHIFNYCKALHQRFGYDIYAYILDDSNVVEAAQAEKPDFIKAVICGAPISKADIFCNVIFKTIFGKDHWPLQESLYFSGDNCKYLDLLNAKEKFDVLFVDMVRLAPYLRAFKYSPSLKILDMGDILSKRYLRQKGNLDKHSNISGSYSSKLPAVMRAFISQKWIQKLILNTEHKLMEHAELLWAKLYDKVILVSTLETEELNRRLDSGKAVTVRVGVDTTFFGVKTNLVKEQGTISFLGDLSTAANCDTVSYIVNTILPLCKNVRKVTFVGKCSSTTQELYKNDKRICFTGMIPDVREVIERSEVFVAPMAYGTGVKIKIIEAMSMGMPVVTNSIGAEGIPGINGVHWLLNDEPAKIAGAIDELLSDSQQCIQIGENARALVEQHFCWTAATAAFSQVGL